MADEDIMSLLDEAHRRWVEKPPPSQSPKRTILYQEAVRDHLVSEGFNRESCHLDKGLPATFLKAYDLLYTPYGIPRLAISFKIEPLHELSAHMRTRLEEATGDAANVHMQFPDLVLGYQLILALDPGKSAALGDWEMLRSALQFFARITGRPSSDSLPSRYEAIGIYVCSWQAGRHSSEHRDLLAKVKAQIPTLLAPSSMVGLLLANYRLRFGQLHEST